MVHSRGSGPLLEVTIIVRSADVVLNIRRNAIQTLSKPSILPIQLKSSFPILIDTLGLIQYTPIHVVHQTFAMTLLDNENDLRTVQALMGHSHIRTTEAYLHSTDGRKVEAIRSLQFGN